VLVSARLAAPLATLVIPCYREGVRLPRLLDALAAEAIATARPPMEIIVVDDGSGGADVEREREATLAVAARLERAGTAHTARFVASPRNRGKGWAIRLGWGEAHPGSAWLGFVDADGAVSARETWRLASGLVRCGDVDVVAGTRVLMAGRAIERSLFRHLQGRVFATLAEETFHLGFYDTQCGLKFFRASALRPLLDTLREERWLLDIEILARLKGSGGRFREEPIDWSDPGDSKLVAGADAARMAIGLWRMRRRLG
jgi:dolichyl-phosphate beta-glucosyltransferase